MKSIVCLLITLGIAYGISLPFKPNCLGVFCTLNLQVCPDGSPAPIPPWGCCPSITACKNPIFTGPITPVRDCRDTFCTMDFKVCPDGRPAPVPPGECCPSLKACNTNGLNSRSNPLSSLGSILSGNNLLQSLSTATQGTNLGTAISILNLLNNVQQFSTDIHQIPLLINQTLASIVNGTGQASQIVVDQLIGALNGAHNQAGTSRNLLGGLGQNANLLSSVSHLLPQGTSISTVLSILNLLNNFNQFNNDIHQIPVVLNQTLANIFDGAGQAGQVVLQQLLNLVGTNTQSAGTSRNLLGGLGQNANLLSSVSHLLPQGTSISTVLSILNLLNNVNQFNNDIHQIPAVLNQTLANIFDGAGQAGQVVLQQLLNLVGTNTQSAASSRDLLGALGQNTNLLSSISHLLPQGTSISTVLSLLNLLNNANALNNDLHQIPAVLQETLNNILNGVQNLIPPLVQPL